MIADKPVDLTEAVRVVKAFCTTPLDQTLSVRSLFAFYVPHASVLHILASKP